jgi:hypothetical protein
MCIRPMFVQSMHLRPSAPHAAVAVPGWQVPLLSQHPMLHVR